MAYTTLADVKAYLKIPTAKTADDALLTTMIARAQAIIEAKTGRVFEAETATYYFHIEDIDGQYLWMPRYDLLTVTTLTNGNGTVIDAANYRLEPRNNSPKWMIKLDNDYSWEFTDGDSEIAVAGTWGWSATPPADIVHATIRLTAVLYRQKDNSADMDRPLVTGDGITIMPSGLPQDVDRLVAPYVRRI